MLGNLTNVGKVGLGIFLVAVVLFVVGFSVPHWAVFHFGHWQFGLWEGCESKISVSKCVSTLNKEFKAFRYLPGWFQATQAFACLALVTIGGNILFRSLFICHKRKIFVFISVILDMVAVAFTFLGAVMFGSEISKYGQVTLLWGFILYVVGGVLLIASAASFLVEYCRLKHKERTLSLDKVER